jgi:hypothetical protein
MRRYILLVVVVALATLIFAPVAVAQDNNPSADDRSMDDRGFEDRRGGGRTFDDNPGADDRSFNDQGFDDNPTGADDRGMDDRGFDDSGSGSHTFDDDPDADDRGSNNRVFDDNPTGADDAMASPTVSASAASGAAGDDVTMMSFREALPSTGGSSLVGLVSAATLVLLVGSGLVARRLVRRGR